MHSFLSQVTRCVLLLALVMLMTGCSFSSVGSTPGSTPTLSTGPIAIPTFPTGPMSVGTLSPTIDTIAQQVLQNMHLHAWNPNAMTHSIVTGGLFINWKMSDPTKTNAVQPGPDGNPQHNHDPQVELYYLTALAEYHLIHPQDTAYDADIGRATTQVLADFRSYSLPKGWVYFYLLKDGLLLHNSALVKEAQTAANNFYRHWYDPVAGIVYNRNHTSRDYSTNHTLQCGAALIDAGLRWHRSDWLNAGEKTIDHTLSSSIDPHYHLFYNGMFASNDGNDRVQNYQAKPSTQGEAADALITAYTLTHRQHYLDVAAEVLQSTFGSNGLWDKALGGFFFAIDMDSGKLLTSYKETRSQTLVLGAVHYYNQVLHQTTEQQLLAQQEQQLIQVLTDRFYQHTYHGFFYRVTTDFQVYVSAPGKGIGVEDYFTTEAMGSALDALQQTELVVA